MMTEDLLIMITALATLVLPNALLISYIFQSHLRLPIWSAITFLLFFITFESILGYKLGLDSTMFRILEFATIPIYALLLCFYIHVEATKLLFVLLLVAAQFTGVRGIAAFIAAYFFHVDTVNILYSWTTITVQSILYVCLLPLTISTVRNCRELITLDAPGLWNILWTIPALSLPSLFLSWNLNNDTADSLIYLILRCVVLFSSFVIHHMLVIFIRITKEQAHLEETNHYNKKMLELQRYQYSVIQTQIEATRRARHDLRQHLALIQACLDNNNHEALQTYVRRYAKTRPSDSTKSYCQNYAVDALVRHYADQANQAKITFDCRLELPKQLPFEEPEIVILFGNLLENALEACQKVPPEASTPFIRIRAQVSGNSAYCITVDNSCSQPPIQSGDDLLSTKHTGPGVGTASIRHIAAQYNGLASFRCEDNIFFASIFLNPPT